MSFRSWRDKQFLSQERIAEMSGLSLRTVQRLEAGHRVSHDSLRALAAAFAVDVDGLERELYAVNRPAEDFVEVPGWARLLSVRLYFGGHLPSRRTHLVIEFLVIALSALVFVGSFVLEEEVTQNALRIAAFAMLVFAVLISLQNRAFDRYGLWAGSERAPPVRARTGGGMILEYVIVLGAGVLGLVMVLFLIS